MPKSKKQDQSKNSSTLSKGAIFLAFNNKEINYVKLACLSASSVRKHLNLPCSLITDAGSLRHFEKLEYIRVDKIFENIIIDEKTDEDYKKDHFYSKYKIGNIDSAVIYIISGIFTSITRWQLRQALNNYKNNNFLSTSTSNSLM